MNALVAVASRHGSTEGIAEAIAEELRAAGIDTDLREADEVLDLEGYTAVVLGSAVYLGNWLPEARWVVERHRERLATVPVWLFSSGPLGEEAPSHLATPSASPTCSRRSGRVSTSASSVNSTRGRSASASGSPHGSSTRPRATSGRGMRSGRGRAPSLPRSWPRLRDEGWRVLAR